MEPFIGQIIMFGGNFAPRGWAFCDGQLLAISQNEALFSILGTTYGGDGRTTFALPDLRGRYAMHPGHGPGLSDRRLGQKGGTENVTLTDAQIPAHNHPASATGSIRVHEEDATTTEPNGNILATSAQNTYSTGGADAALNAGALQVNVTLGNNGGSQSHTNMPPFECANFIIALVGVYPSRS